MGWLASKHVFGGLIMYFIYSVDLLDFDCLFIPGDKMKIYQFKFVGKK